MRPSASVRGSKVGLQASERGQNCTTLPLAQTAQPASTLYLQRPGSTCVETAPDRDGENPTGRRRRRPRRVAATREASAGCCTQSLGVLPRFAWPAAAGSRRPALQAGSQLDPPHAAAEGRAAWPLHARPRHHASPRLAGRRRLPTARPPGGQPTRSAPRSGRRPRRVAPRPAAARRRGHGGLEGRRRPAREPLAFPPPGGGCRGHGWPGSRKTQNCQMMSPPP
jgi:hypothetical protein